MSRSERTRDNKLHENDLCPVSTATRMGRGMVPKSEMPHCIAVTAPVAGEWLSESSAVSVVATSFVLDERTSETHLGRRLSKGSRDRMGYPLQREFESEKLCSGNLTRCRD